VFWFTVWFMVILKIPIVYLAYVIWWAMKDPPEAAAGSGEAGGSPGWSPRPAAGRDRVAGRRRGPHGSPARRPARPAHARALKGSP
jgi:hypothetical protein